MLRSRQSAARSVPLVRIVADTNTVVSGLLWHGPPRQILDTARLGNIQIVTSLSLLHELEDVLRRPKLASRLALANTSVEELVLGYASLATIVEPASITAVVLDDPDDDAVLACALAAAVDIIVSGDRHLLELGAFQGIPVLAASQALAQIPG